MPFPRRPAAFEANLTKFRLDDLQKACCAYVVRLFRPDDSTLEDSPSIETDAVQAVMLYVVAQRFYTLAKRYISSRLETFRQNYRNMSQMDKFDYLDRAGLLSKTDDKHLYGVSWKYVLPLVKKRAIHIQKGKVRVNASHFEMIACYLQMDRIIYSLLSVHKMKCVVESDSRLAQLLDDLIKLVDRCQYQSRNKWRTNKEGAHLNNLCDLSESFPPCMERMYAHMENKHHLRYYGRMQFIPFLKDIGLSVDECLCYFQTHSLQIMSDEERKRKRYEYYIKYQYGLVGGRVEKYCSDCSKIQYDSSEGCLDCHGCPFLSANRLEQLFALPNYVNMLQSDKQCILSEVGKTSAKVLCAKTLALKLNDSIDSNRLPKEIVNPMQYFCIYSQEKENEEVDLF